MSHSTPIPQPKLNQGQNQVADDYFAFLMSSDPFFVISGPAGTGKTFLMNHLSNGGMQIYHDACKLMGTAPQFDEVHFTATTNKAAEVLETSIGKPVMTVHSFLSLKVKENWKTGKTEITKTNNWRIRRNMILFIDECSMIDTQLFNLLLETMVDSKIVFVGDHSQMAPVSEDLSPLYKHVKPENFGVLTEPVRNAGTTALVDLCAQLRDTVETGIFKPIAEVPGIIDYLDDTSMPVELTQSFQDMDPSARILCYTNARTQEYNEFVRDDVRSLPPEITPGDIMVVASAYQMGKVSLSVERELKVVSVGPIEEDRSCSDIMGDEPILYRKVSFTNPNDQGLIEGIRVAVNQQVVAWAAKTYAKARMWSSYFETKGAYLDLRDKAACTVYKSQGSTYDMVFIDLGNIGTSYDSQQVARMLYVAVSRARSRVCFYGRLPSRYYDSKGVPLWTVTSGQPESLESSSPETNAA